MPGLHTIEPAPTIGRVKAPTPAALDLLVHTIGERIARHLERRGLLRQYIPKGTDLSKHSGEELDAVASTLNGRPRKMLEWKTPAEALDEYLSSQQESRCDDPLNSPYTPVRSIVRRWLISGCAAR